MNWDEVFAYLGWPIFMKPAYGGGWKDVYKCDNPQEFFAAYDQTRDLAMMAQEAIEFEPYYRCYVLGRSRVRIMALRPEAAAPSALREESAADGARVRGAHPSATPSPSATASATT